MKIMSEAFNCSIFLMVMTAVISVPDSPKNAKRVTCEDLGRCNLRTGEVHPPMTQENAAKLVYLFSDAGVAP